MNLTNITPGSNVKILTPAGIVDGKIDSVNGNEATVTFTFKGWRKAPLKGAFCTNSGLPCTNAYHMELGVKLVG